MRLLRLIFIVAPLAAAIYIGLKAIDQFENFQEFGAENLTSFHLFNIAVLAFIAVGLVVLAIAVTLADDFNEPPISVDDYLKSVFAGTLGAVTFAIGLYESAITEGNALPAHYGNGYHTGDTLAVTWVGLAFIVLAGYFVIKGVSKANAAAAERNNASPEEPSPDEEHEDEDPDVLVVHETVIYVVPLIDELDSNVSAELSFEVDGTLVTADFEGKVEDVTYGLSQVIDVFFPEEKEQ